MIPKYEEIMLPLLKYISDQEEHSLSSTHDVLSEKFKLSDQEVREIFPSGNGTIFKNRLSWAKTYMVKAGLIHPTRRGYFRISTEGVELLNENPTEINSKFLTRYQSFVEFKFSKRSETKIDFHNSNQTLEENLEQIYRQLHSELSKDLLDHIKSCSPNFFERLVIDLLLTMGYGGSRKDVGQVIGKSGDGGIDGIINEDRLGLDVIYIQAKRWDKTVPLKEIRDFTGALASKQAKKGIFITTSNFPSSVYEYIEKVEYKIVLIDGERLTDLMIEYDVGTSNVNTYNVKTVDLEYFEGG